MPTDALNDILQMDSAQVFDWLNNNWSSGNEDNKNFNWIGLAQAAAQNAATQRDTTWALVATTIYDYLSQSLHVQHSESFMNSSMNIRAYMIRLLGNQTGDHILDIDRLVSWFFSDLTIIPSEALHVASEWKESEDSTRREHLDDVRQMRRIKNRLSILKTAFANDTLHPSESLREWLLIWDYLP